MSRRSQRSGDFPINAHYITTYADLEQHAQVFAKGHLNLLILLGRPGLGKTRVFRALGDAVSWIDGISSACGLYRWCWGHRDRLIVMDDLDLLRQDRKCIPLMKCLCQTENIKRLGWHTEASTLTRDGVPLEFETTSQVCVIANEWRTLNAHIAALEDRGHVVVFDPSGLEVHKRVAAWFDDQEILDYFASVLHLIDQPSLRAYGKAKELKLAGFDWRSQILTRWGVPANVIQVAALKADPNYPTEEERARAFVAAGHGSRSTYFNAAGKLKPRASVPALSLPNVSPAPTNGS